MNNALYFDEAGQEVTVADLVSQMKVGVSGHFTSLTVDVPTNLRTADDLRRIHEEATAFIVDLVGNRALQLAENLPDAAPPSANGQLMYAPKAAERVPGQWWETTITHYKLTAEKMELWRENAKYPDAHLYPNSPQWPAAWIGHMQADGALHEFGKPVRMVQQVSEKKNTHGTYYVDVTTLEVIHD